MTTRSSSTQTTSSKEKNMTTTTLPIKLAKDQVRSNRFTVFTEKQRVALLECDAVKQFAGLYGVKVDEVFTKSGKVKYVGVEKSRGFLDDLKKMTARRFTANALGIELARVAYGWTDKRIAQARKSGAGPERKGWAAVHAAHKKATRTTRRSRSKKS